MSKVSVKKVRGAFVIEIPSEQLDRSSLNELERMSKSEPNKKWFPSAGSLIGFVYIGGAFSAALFLYFFVGGN